MVAERATSGKAGRLVLLLYSGLGYSAVRPGRRSTAPGEGTTGIAMRLQGKKIGVLIESDFYEKEIFYYEHRFPEAGMEVHFLSRLWGQPSLTFYGHEYKVPFECHESFEHMDDATLRSYAAIIVPSAIVADRLRYTEDIAQLPPAAVFLQRAFAEPGILKGIICHGM